MPGRVLSGPDEPTVLGYQVKRSGGGSNSLIHQVPLIIRDGTRGWISTFREVGAGEGGIGVVVSYGRFPKSFSNKIVLLLSG